MPSPLHPSVATLLLLSGACTATDGETGAAGEFAGTACNGRTDLCDRTLPQVTLPGTHNSMSSADAGWIAPNQQHGLTRQLEDGVRALMLDVHDQDGEPFLCHGYCSLGSQPLSEGLGEIEAFLATHPREVVVVIFEDYVAPATMVDAIDASGLGARAFTPPAAGEPWPTLGEMVAADARILLTAQGGGATAEDVGVDWYVGAWDVFFDTPYSFETAADFSCALNRGSADHALFLVNHWVADPLPVESEAAQVNAADVLGTRARDCAEEWGRPVTFLGVDFYAVGDLFEVVDGLNDELGGGDGAGDEEGTAGRSAADR